LIVSSGVSTTLNESWLSAPESVVMEQICCSGSTSISQPATVPSELTSARLAVAGTRQRAAAKMRVRIRSGAIRATRLVMLLTLDDQFLDLTDRLGRVEILRTGLRAIHDRMAAVEPERIFEIVQALTRRLVPAVGKPAIRLQKDGRPK